MDEFHLVGENPVAELESLCKMLTFYPEYRGWRLVATASEGWVLASRLESRLLGYGSWTLLLEELDEEHTSSLYDEYTEAHGCVTSPSLCLALVGGYPGYIPVLCPLTREELEEWVEARITEVIRALVEVAEPGEGLDNVVEGAYRLIVGGEPALDKRLLRIGEHLTVSKHRVPSAQATLQTPAESLQPDTRGVAGDTAHAHTSRGASRG